MALQFTTDAADQPPVAERRGARRHPPGSSCGELKIQCCVPQRRTSDYQPLQGCNCETPPWFSEENGGTQFFPAGKYARGVECSGSRCDNMRLLVCEL